MDYPIRTLQQLRPILIGFRKQAGLSQTKVAGLLGITQQSYAKIEANPASSSVERIFTILRLLGAEIAITPASNSTKDATTVEPRQEKINNRSPASAPAKLFPPSKDKEQW